MPKVTFIIDGETQTVEFETGQLPYTHHGKPRGESEGYVTKYVTAHVDFIN